MSLSFGGSKTKQKQQQSETYNPNAGFVSGVQGLLTNAGQMTYKPTTQAGIDSFANPYIDGVTAQTSADLRRSRDITGNDLDAKAAAAGAFGGSGWGLLRGENNRSAAEAEAAAIGNIRAGAYDRSVTAAQNESQGENNFNLQQLLARLQGYGLLNYGTTNSTGKSSGSGMNFGATFKYGG